MSFGGEPERVRQQLGPSPFFSCPGNGGVVVVVPLLLNLLLLLLAVKGYGSWLPLDSGMVLRKPNWLVE